MSRRAPPSRPDVNPNWADDDGTSTTATARNAIIDDSVSASGRTTASSAAAGARRKKSATAAALAAIPDNVTEVSTVIRDDGDDDDSQLRRRQGKARRGGAGNNNNNSDSDEEYEEEEEEEDDGDGFDSDADGGSDDYDVDAPLPEHACRYCRRSDPLSAVRCNTCRKWFCNTRVGSSGSHIIMHMAACRHKEISLHETGPMGDAVLECFSCGSRNAFLLGFLPSKEESVVVLICREPCLNSQVLQEMDWDPSAWSSIIEERQLLPWIAATTENVSAIDTADGGGGGGGGGGKQKGGKQHRRVDPRVRAITSKQIASLEEKWKIDPDADLDTVLPGRAAETLPEIPVDFVRVEDYRAIMSAHVEAEALTDKEMKEKQVFEQLMVRWTTGVNGRRVATLEVATSENVLREGDEVLIVYPDTQQTEVSGVVLSIAPAASMADEIQVELRAGAPDPPGLSVLVSGISDGGAAPAAGASGSGGGYRLRLTWNKSPYERMQKAIRTFATDEMSISAYLFTRILGQPMRAGQVPQIVPPEDLPEGDELNAPGLARLNPSQHHAVRDILMKPLGLVQGPPGTGKTLAGATIVYNLSKLHGAQILVTAPSNVTVDQLAERIALTGLNVVRVCARGREALPATNAAAEKLSLHHLVRQFAAEAHRFSELGKLFKLRDTVGNLSESDKRRFSRLCGEVERLILEEADVVLSTCVGAADLRLAPYRFKYVVVDECTHATEPEVLIPLVSGAKQVILIGDHCLAKPDMEIMTNRGWMGYDALYAAWHTTGELRDGRLQIAGYDVAAQCIVYETPTRFIDHDGAPSDGLYDICTDAHVHIRVTGKHQLLIRDSACKQQKQAAKKERRFVDVTVEQVLDGTWPGKLHPSRLGADEAVHLVSTAANGCRDGVDVAEALAEAGVHLADLCPALRDSATAAAKKKEIQLEFARLFGAWHTCGSLAVSGPDTNVPSVRFVAAKPGDRAVLLRALCALGLLTEEDFVCSETHDGRMEVDVHRSSWVTLFFGEYGYAHPQFRDTFDFAPHQLEHFGGASAHAALVRRCKEAAPAAISVHGADEKLGRWLSGICFRLSAEFAKALLAGISTAGNDGTVSASSAHFRDDCMRLALHAGMTIHGEKKNSGDDGSELWTAEYSAPPCDDAGASSSCITRRQIKKVDGYKDGVFCVAVPSAHIVVRRAPTSGHATRPVILHNCQMQPVVLSRVAERAGMNRSLFERLVLLGERPHRLEIQYRMHPCLSEFSSNYFYEGALANGVSAEERDSSRAFPWPDPRKPMFFYNSIAPEEMGPSGVSYLNRAEAALAEKFVTRLLKSGLVTPDQIGVITPYEAQRCYIVNYFVRNGSMPADAYRRIEVTSVDGFQGREKEFIVLSCVRSNDQQGIGFVQDWRRLNVALTRARRGLAVIGNARVLARHPLWHGLVSHFKEQNLVVNGSVDAGLTAVTIALPKPRVSPAMMLELAQHQHYMPSFLTDASTSADGLSTAKFPVLVTGGAGAGGAAAAAASSSAADQQYVPGGADAWRTYQNMMAKRGGSVSSASSSYGDTESLASTN